MKLNIKKILEFLFYIIVTFSVIWFWLFWTLANPHDDIRRLNKDVWEKYWQLSDKISKRSYVCFHRTGYCEILETEYGPIVAYLFDIEEKENNYKLSFCLRNTTEFSFENKKFRLNLGIITNFQKVMYDSESDVCRREDENQVKENMKIFLFTRHANYKKIDTSVCRELYNGLRSYCKGSFDFELTTSLLAHTDNLVSFVIPKSEEIEAVINTFKEKSQESIFNWGVFGPYLDYCKLEFLGEVTNNEPIYSGFEYINYNQNLVSSKPIEK